ncbi:siderophore ABC transporter substrate-binding protein [Paenibacillus sp.]|uniref:siderophore ABC transporter substrate-binding protein n=1 Tax=Paenibacillus sp. TaxID=58172 RepID=UPI00281262D5|nr:siderophore ABC transporter substrate-binding protein [Paenibacillus sp.]
MKKFSVWAVLLVMMLVVAACGGGNASEDGTNGAAETPAAEQPAAETPPVEAPAAPTEITVKHQLGETVVPVNPEKVVVFDWGALDTLDMLGVPVTAVPQSSSIPPYMEKYGGSEYINVGSLVEPDFEKIAEVDPDLILISGRQSANYEEFTKLAPTVFIGVDNANYMESFKNNVTILGQIFQKEAEVAAEVEAVEKAVADLNAASTTGGKNALIVLTNEGKISAYGPGSRFGIIHGAFGIPAVDEGIVVETHGQSVTYEYIVEKDPDYLFVIDRNAVVTTGEAAPAGSLSDNELIKNTKAYKNNKIIYLDPNYWYLSGGGLVSVSEMVKQVAESTK